MTGAAILLAGCTHSVDITAPTPTGAVGTQCAALVAAAPSTVADQDAREISPSSRYVAAWGDPAIVLRCGGAAPAALTPTSQCFVVSGVGWLVTQGGVEVDPARVPSATLTFTTVGRSAYVDVTVPGSYQPAADAVVDLAGTIKQHTTQRRPCR